MTGIYLNDWSSIDGLKADFKIANADLEGVEILVASYTYEYYSGSAYVLFSREGKLFEVHGSHCSCYDLEGQWEPEEADREAILHRLTKGTWGEADRIKDHVIAALSEAA